MAAGLLRAQVRSQLVLNVGRVDVQLGAVTFVHVAFFRTIAIPGQSVKLRLGDEHDAKLWHVIQSLARGHLSSHVHRAVTVDTVRDLGQARRIGGQIVRE